MITRSARIAARASSRRVYLSPVVTVPSSFRHRMASTGSGGRAGQPLRGSHGAQLPGRSQEGTGPTRRQRHTISVHDGLYEGEGVTPDKQVVAY
jgi:hypothetical protein